MSTREPEIVSLSEFRAELAEPGEDRLARMRLRLDNGPAAHRRWSPRAIAIPVVAAASVLTVVIGAAVIGLGGSGSTTGLPASQPTAPLSTPRPTVEAPAPPTEKTASTPDRPTEAEHKAAVDLLERFAAAAANGPAPLAVPDGRLLYVRGEGGSSDDSTARAYLHELWLDVNGCIPLRIRRTDGGQVIIDTADANPKNNHGQEVQEQRARLAAEGPSLRLPTPAYLAGLPTDPDAMLALLRAPYEQGGSAWSTDRSVFKDVSSTLYNTEPLLTPQVRASLYRAIAKVDSIGSTGERFDLGGRSVYAIAHTERGQRQELLLDAETGRVVGTRLIGADTAAEAQFYELWSYAVVSQPGQTG